jgi:hypothetical protein
MSRHAVRGSTSCLDSPRQGLGTAVSGLNSCGGLAHQLESQEALHDAISAFVGWADSARVGLGTGQHEPAATVGSTAPVNGV